MLRRTALVAVLTAGMVAAWAALASAQCVSTACPEPQKVEDLRGLIAAACDCVGAGSHKAYVKCAKGMVKDAIGAGTLPKACKKPVMRCESRSTCGQAGRSRICCASARGRVKAKTIRNGGRCGGEVCSDPMSLEDACTPEGSCRQARRAIRSFRSVQQVFTASCALPSCHSTFARQGKLVLDSEDVSLASLVGRASDHPDAKAAGLLRVAPGDPANSFLIRKLRGQGPGDPMPQAGQPLSEPVIAMIEDWIARGARSTEAECRSDAGASLLCQDETGPIGDFHWQPQAPLEPPPAPTGIQLHIPPRDVLAGTEWEMCYTFRPDWAKIAADLGYPPGQLPIIKNQTYRMHEGSHHLLLYMYFGKYPEVWPEGFFPCVAASCTNPDDCPPEEPGDFTSRPIPIGGTQVAGTRYEVVYPDGVGIPILSPNAVIIGNPHFTNTFQPAQDVYGEAWLNLEFYRPEEFKVNLDGIFAINFAELFVEPFQSRTISRVWQPRAIVGGASVDAAVFQLFGHMHKRGTLFQIDYLKGSHCSEQTQRVCGRDEDCPPGQTCVYVPNSEDTTIYHTEAWDQAPIMDFPPPYFPVAKDEGLRWTCTHQNGVQGDPTRPPKTCKPGCRACGWVDGYCSTNGQLCRVSDAGCDPDEACVADTTGLSPSSYRCRDEERGRWGGFCCPGTCTPADDAQKCWFSEGVARGFQPPPPRIYQKDEPMPLVFGELADDDMCNMFGYFVNAAALPLLQ